jgi:outer membrane murein-binding lipoprotein Lpp
MTIGRKLLALWAIIVAVLVVWGVGISWRAHRVKSEVNNVGSTLDELNKDIADLNKELEKMIAEADAAIKKTQHFPKPTNGVNVSYHDGGREDSWVQDIDKKEGIVLVTTIDSRKSIVFKPAPGAIENFHVGWIAPVTFQCTKIKKGKCDFKAPYKLFVSNGLVEVQQLVLPKK